MTVSIRVDNSGKVTTINQKGITGEGWIQLEDIEIPEITEDNVSTEYYWDGDSVTVETTTVSTDETI